MAMRWGLIGCGDVARKRVAAAISNDPKSELVAGCRRDEAKLQQFCDDFSIPQQFTNDQALINSADIDAVYISTPVGLHLPQTLAALAAGKHVLVEKPMAMTTAECQQMIDTAQQANRTLGVAYYRRFYPVYQRIKQLLAEEVIGQVLSVNVVAAAPMDMGAGEDGYWRVLPELGGGGPIMDVGSHRLDLLLDLLGAPEKIVASCSTVAANYQAEDVGNMNLTFTRGIQASVQCLFGTPVDPDVFQIIGTKGNIESTPLNGGELVIRTADGVTNESHPPHSNFNSPLIADFIEAIEQGRSPLPSAADGLQVNQVMQLAYASSKAMG